MLIFISYSSKDRELVKSLADDLELLGHQIWFDSELLRTGGQKWWATILTPDSKRRNANLDCDVEFG